VDGGPGWVSDLRAARRIQESSLDQVVECGLEEFERLWLIALAAGRVLGYRECGVEEARLCAGEVEVCPADGLEPESCPGWCARSRSDPTHPVGHALSESPDRFAADSREEGVAVGEMAVGRIGNYPDDARRLSQHDGLRTARSRKLDAGLDERRAHSPARAGSLPPWRIVRLPLTRGPLVVC